MYELVLNYITALAPAASAIIACIVMFVRIITRVREMTCELSHKNEKDLKEAQDVFYAQVSTMKEEIKRITDSNEMAQMKEQYARVMRELEELTKQNAELLAKLETRGY
uniref:Uncharacterized protein n=1 Tax=Herelleviridae sp. ct7M529 TaxID=2826787 RepID=A0A8S5LWM7_9CAUD|nr:MAG TPA: hypothetical protein [Herelleviridae sp. ct7M529]